MTSPAFTPDSFSAYLITDLIIRARSDQDSFLDAIHSIGDLNRFCDIAMTDEFDCPDDIHELFDIDEDTDLNAVRNDPRTFDMVFDAMTRFLFQLSICPIHLHDYAICFDDQLPECAQQRIENPAHDT